MPRTSIYEAIRRATNENGLLPDDFELPTPSGELSFAPGALDAIQVFHMNQPVTANINEVLTLLKTGNIEEIERVIDEHRTITLIDELLSQIRHADNRPGPEALSHLARQMALGSSHIETVKLGIAVMQLFDFSQDSQLGAALLHLGLCDEFTMYVLAATADWPQGPDIAFWIAQRVTGWGRVHAVRHLNTDVPGASDWIIQDGCQNDELDPYLGLMCALKGDLIGRLRARAINDRDFDGISRIINALLDEGPFPGISDYEYAGEALERYLTFARNSAPNLAQLARIANLAQALPDLRLRKQRKLVSLANQVLSRPGLRESVIPNAIRGKNLDEFYDAVMVARHLGMDYHELLLGAVLDAPLAKTQFLDELFSRPDSARELVATYETVLPLTELASGMGTELFASRLPNEHRALEEVLWQLDLCPLQGEALIRAGLGSPVVRERNVAYGVLHAWTEALGQPVSKFSPLLHQTLAATATIEVDAETKDNLISLL